MPIITASSNSEGGLGQALVGEKITINTTTTILVKELLGEGTFFLKVLSVVIVLFVIDGDIYKNF